MNVGDTFVNVETPVYPSHLWFVASRPDAANRVVIVNISSDDGGLGDLEKLQREDHPWIQHESFIRSDLAMLSRLDSIRAALAARPPAVTAEGPCGGATLIKIQRALLRSRHTKREIKQVLIGQELPS